MVFLSQQTWRMVAGPFLQGGVMLQAAALGYFVEKDTSSHFQSRLDRSEGYSTVIGERA
jgi:hypothetical protein